MIAASDILADIHTHTIASGHAYGTIREMTESAGRKKLKLLGISEHGPGIPGTCDPIYFSNLSVAPKHLNGTEILYGCEVNVLNDGTLSMGQKYLNYLDFVIIGIHKQCYHDEGILKNTENVISCMKFPKVCLVSHPDDDHTPLDYERLVLGAKKYQVALELNNSSLLKEDKRLHCVENYKKMLRLCRQYAVPVIVSSDAHDPAYVGRFEEACELLNREGFDRELILNTDLDRLKDYIKRAAARKSGLDF